MLTESLAGTYRVPPAQGRGSRDPLVPGALEWGPSGQKRKKKGKKEKEKKNITCLLLREGTNRKAERIMMINREKKI